MPRARLGVVLLLPSPLREEVQGLRRAVGDPSLDRIPPHITLVPPVNVPEARLPEVLDVLRQAAATTRPFRVVLGPPATFLPVNPVLFLAVGGDVAAVHGLRDAVSKEPLARPPAWPYVPHVTLADEAPPEVIDAGLSALACYRAEVTLERLYMLREGEGRVWAPIADAPFQPPAVIGRGGLPLELTVSERLDVEASGARPFAVTARRDGRVVATAAGRLEGDVCQLDRLEVEPDARRQGVGSHVLAAVESLAGDEGCGEVWAGAPEGSDCELFLRGRGWTERTRQQRVELRRRL